MKIVIVAGARPNFPKIAPIIKEIEKYDDVDYYLVHTGQHYDKNLSQEFFDQLSIPAPDINLGIGSGSHTEQTAKVMLKFEKVLEEQDPDYVLVVGDVNSTIAAALVAKKEHVKLIHVEAGLRSFDENMPEEINRILVDRISDLLFVTEKSGVQNLKNEGVNDEKIKFVGNVMIDNLVQQLPEIKKQEQLVDKEHAVVTLHRPSNVDDKENLIEILNFFKDLQDKVKIVWPVHPRFLKMVEKFSLEKLYNKLDQIKFTKALDYYTFMKLVSTSKFVLTDSGGIQEETTYLGIPCITLRTSTERPSTIDVGSNTLTGLNFNKINKTINNIFESTYKKGSVPKFWDGKTSERIVDIIRGVE